MTHLHLAGMDAPAANRAATARYLRELAAAVEQGGPMTSHGQVYDPVAAVVIVPVTVAGEPIVTASGFKGMDNANAREVLGDVVVALETFSSTGGDVAAVRQEWQRLDDTRQASTAVAG